MPARKYVHLHIVSHIWIGQKMSDMGFISWWCRSCLEHNVTRSKKSSKAELTEGSDRQNPDDEDPDQDGRSEAQQQEEEDADHHRNDQTSDTHTHTHIQHFTRYLTTSWSDI